MRTLHLLLVLPIALLFGCSDKAEPSNGSGGSASANGGAPGQGGTPGSGGSTASSGGSSTGGSSGGAHASGGMTNTGQGGAAAGGAAAKGGGSNTSGSSNASGGSNTSGGSNATGGSNSGGSPSAGAGGTLASGGAPNASGGGSNAAGCTREWLKSTIDAYFKALAAHDPSGLPTASNVKFTENGKAMALGSGGLWKTAGALKYSHSALDTEGCNSATQAVVPDGNMDIPLGLRLKVVNQQITEIETIAVRPGDYSALASNTAALAASANTIKWETSVPTDQRNTRQELTSWMDKYFRMFPRGVCNTTTDCKRIENGGGNFSCSAGASCASGSPSGSPAMTPRLIFADTETGLGVGFTMFQNTDTDMHMFKMYGGKVYGVSAILGAAGSSGWD